jgi:anti-sigma B factor antagonist
MKIFKRKNENGNIFLKIEGKITIHLVNSLKQVLLDFLQKSGRFEIDLSGVTRIDTAGFQLIYLIRREAANNNIVFTIVNPAVEVKRIFRLFGEEIPYPEKNNGLK